MTNRVPIVLGDDGLPQQGQAVDTLTWGGQASFGGAPLLASSFSGQFAATGLNIEASTLSAGTVFAFTRSGLRKIAFNSTATTDDFSIRAFNDTGGLVDSPLTIIRAAGGAITFSAARPIFAGVTPIFPILPTPYGVTTISADANFTPTLSTATVVGTKRVIRLTGTITANRTLTLPTGAVEGNNYRIVRTGGGSFTFSVVAGSTTLKALAQNTWVDVEWDVTTAAWIETAYGSL